MRKNPTIPFFWFLLIFTASVHSQILEGVVLDKSTQEALPGATVYLDGTTISTITDEQGNFHLNTKNNNNTLVVSFMGYTTHRIENPSQYLNKKLKVLLAEQSISLEEVVVGKSPFTRKQMMQAFKQQFLGRSKSANSCKIENEEDIVLHYDVKTNTLSATARNPLKIKNNHLAYEVNFDLVEFIVNYKVKSLDEHYLNQSYFSGTTFYKDISKNKKADKKRKEKFYGSAYHFMHTLANNRWKEEELSLYVDKFRVDPSEYFKVIDTLGFKKVSVIKQPERVVPKPNITGITFKGDNVPATLTSTEVIKKPTYFNILYQKDKQSVIDFAEKDVYVDENGNYMPLYGVLFGGYLGTLKAGDMLPTDYYQTIKEMQKK